MSTENPYTASRTLKFEFECDIELCKNASREIFKSLKVLTYFGAIDE